jgi:hypothetical protein
MNTAGTEEGVPTRDMGLPHAHVSFKPVAHAVAVAVLGLGSASASVSGLLLLKTIIKKENSNRSSNGSC